MIIENKGSCYRRCKWYWQSFMRGFHASGAKSIVVVDINYEDAKKTADSIGGLAIQASVALKKKYKM